MIRTAAVLLAFLTALTASAQRPFFDPDDFLDQRATDGRPVFISRIVVGAASNMSGDGFRPLGERVGYVHLANSFYWRGMQFDYKRSEIRAEDGEAAEWEFVFEGQQEGQYRQTHNATPKSKDTLHAAWYWPVAGGEGIPVMLRSRVTFTTQGIDTVSIITTPVTGHATFGSGTSVTRTSSRVRTFAVDTDTWFRIAGHGVFGSLMVSETKTTGAPTNPNKLANRDERALAYTQRFPSVSLDSAKILIRPTLTVGGISNRDSSLVNLVNPAIEIFRPFAHSRANLHVIWSPQWTANGNDWKVKHQVAVLIDSAVFVKVF